MINNKKILCIIPAKAKSIGVPGKNYRNLYEEPLFMWSVYAAQQSKYIDYIYVSSNCPYVKEIFFDYLEDMAFLDEDISKIGWIQRPDELATSSSRNEEFLLHALEILKNNNIVIPDIVIHLQPTSPIRNNNLVDKCIEKYDKGRYDSLLTGPKDTPFIWQKIKGKWEYTVDKNGCCNRKMRQEFENTKDNSEFIWHDCGNVYITDTKILLEKKCRIGDNPYIFEVDKFQSLQIDEEDDFILIENIAKVKKWKSLI